MRTLIALYCVLAAPAHFKDGRPLKGVVDLEKVGSRVDALTAQMQHEAARLKAQHEQQQEDDGFEEFIRDSPGPTNPNSLLEAPADPLAKMEHMSKADIRAKQMSEEQKNMEGMKRLTSELKKVDEFVKAGQAKFADSIDFMKHEDKLDEEAAEARRQAALKHKDAHVKAHKHKKPSSLVEQRQALGGRGG